MLDDHNHNNLWADTASVPPATTVLSRDHVADVAIIGGGFTGLSAALHLAELDQHAIVLEARDIGHGGSGRNVGLVNAGMWVMPNDLIDAQGLEWGTRLIQALGDGPALVFDLIARFGIECEAVRNGTLHLGVGSAGDKELGEREAQWQALGAPVRRLNRADAEVLTGTSAFSSALLDERAGTLQPLSYARGLAAAAQAAGATIFTHSPVTSAHHENDHWTLETPGGTVRAKWIIVASNAYSGLEKRYAFVRQQDELTLLPFFQFATEVLPEEIAARILPQGHGCWDTRTVMTAFRKDNAGRLIFGSVGALDPISLGAQRAFAQRSIARLFPFLSKVRLDHCWHGQIGMTDNALPKFHHHGPKAIGVNGFNGRGIAPGTVFGRAMARHIVLGEQMLLPQNPVGRARLGRVRTRAYKLGSHLLHLASSRF
ncbi:FAD-binding oxidoreductase [Pelagibacterium flavum]|uniref:FAD-binding oxidoreductase n=1 Tax=Pelagibacterium flavum TaxID=2984530 RepID=A0ABY6IQG3_9HYPH|nr:FAD-binding oxidoreductase [Pelagibacterium sp. YIM 151497]UYQ71960.1 FAD-binding oxidoreductase [Pelagibacterium sp. YIM 151497]